MSQSCTVVLRDGVMSLESRQALANAMAALLASPDRTLVLHFHGGLVNQRDAEVIAARLAPEYETAGAFSVFVVWQTGLLETLNNNWEDVFTKEAFEAVLERVLQFLVGKVDQPPGAKGVPLQVKLPKEIRSEIVAKREIGEEPFQTYGADAESQRWELNEIEKRQFLDAVTGDNKIRAAAVTLMADNLERFEPQLKSAVAAARDDNEKGGKGILTTLLAGVALRAFMGALRRFSRGRGHGLYPTAVEEVAKAIWVPGLLGKFAWEAMKKDTKQAFSCHQELAGGSAILQEIDQMWARGRRPRITLVGHSAGSIFICEMLKAAAASNMSPGLKFEIALLAPACSFKLLDDTLTLAPNRISAFRSFAMSDELEQKDALIKRVYPRSLLYFVSGVLESESDEPLVGMQRFHTRKSPFDDDAYPGIKRVIDGLQSHANGWIWSLSSGGIGINTACRTHGGFDDEERTIESLKHFVQAGGAAQ